MPACLGRFVVLALLLAAPGQAAAAGRVASATVCADQYVLALAAPEQIAALSPDAVNPRLSLLSEQARDIPRLRPGAEAYLDAGVEVMVTNAWTDHQTAALLERFAVRVVRIPMADTYEGIAEATRTVAAALGRQERGEAVVAAMRARLDAVARRAPGKGREALYLRPDGGTAGPGSFVAAVMETAGLRNQAEALGKRGWASHDLEHFIAAPPDMIVTSFFGSPYPTARSGFGGHPAFTRRAAAMARADVPGALWVCGGWILADAAEHLAADLEAAP